MAEDMILSGPIVGLTCLRHLDVSGTKVVVEDVYTLAYLPSLKFLNMSYCQIRDQISTDNTSIIRNMGNLETLDLSHNDITFFQWLDIQHQAPKLKRLILKGNQIQAVPELTPKALHYLDVSWNHFTSSRRKKGNVLISLKFQLSGNSS